MIRIANAQFWVLDQDEALAFYTRTLGSGRPACDVPTRPAWNFRRPCVGTRSEQRDFGLRTQCRLHRAPDARLLKSSARLAELVAKGSRRHAVSWRRRTVRPDYDDLSAGAASPSTTRRPGQALRHRHVVPGPFRQQRPADPGAGVRPRSSDGMRDGGLRGNHGQTARRAVAISAAWVGACLVRHPVAVMPPGPPPPRPRRSRPPRPRPPLPRPQPRRRRPPGQRPQAGPWLAWPPCPSKDGRP